MIRKVLTVVVLALLGYTAQGQTQTVPPVVIASLPYTITVSGKYVLAGNLTGLLDIEADNVDVNLKTFSITGNGNAAQVPPAGVGTGILVGPHSAVAVRNGSVTASPYNAIVVAKGASETVFANLTVTAPATDSNSGCIADLGDGTTIHNCHLQSSTGFAILCFGTDEVVSGCDYSGSQYPIWYRSAPFDGDTFINNTGGGVPAPAPTPSPSPAPGDGGFGV